MMEGLPHQLASFKHAVLMLPFAALLGAALGVLRPIRRSLVPRSSHVIQTQILLAVVGAAVMIIVADSLARARLTATMIMTAAPTTASRIWVWMTCEDRGTSDRRIGRSTPSAAPRSAANGSISTACL